jgi:hypothetical protein
MVKTFEEWTARTAEIGGNRHFPRIDTENPRDLRGENQPPTPEKIASCQLSDGHYLGVLFLMTRSGSLELARHDWLAALTYTVNYVDHPAWEVNHVWSLSLEEQFYLIWPLAFMVFGPRGWRRGSGSAIMRHSDTVAP